MTEIKLRDAAVSPVIGVMLMLVVTIIIAAVVSAFAGSLAGGTNNAPQMAISGKLIDGDKLILTHKGGDALVWENIEIRSFIPSGWYKDTNYLINMTQGTYDPTSMPISWGAPPLTNGESASFLWEDIFYDTSASYGGYTPQKGEPVDIQIYDKESGKMILSTRVTNS